jgi:hypothetical protein
VLPEGWQLINCGNRNYRKYALLKISVAFFSTRAWFILSACEPATLATKISDEDALRRADENP